MAIDVLVKVPGWLGRERRLWSSINGRIGRRTRSARRGVATRLTVRPGRSQPNSTVRSPSTTACARRPVRDSAAHRSRLAT